MNSFESSLLKTLQNEASFYKNNPVWWRYMTKDSQLSLKFINDNIHYQWDAFELSDRVVREKYYDILINHPEWKWNWNWISINIQNFDFVKQYIHLKWNWDEISLNNSYITPSVLINNLDLKWNWSFLSNNDVLYSSKWSFENFVMKYQNLPWNWEAVKIKSSIFV